jgi:heme-degrading monooxygenase HmoA
MADEECTAIVAYEVLNEDRPKFLEAWEKADEYLKGQPGYLRSELHQAVSANPDFRYVNIGCWKNAEDFRTATQSNGFREASGSLEAYPVHASAYEVVRS